MKNLDEQIRAHYTGKALPEDRVREILDSGGRRSTGKWIPAMAAAVLVLGFAWMTQDRGQDAAARLVLTEIAMNHAKALDLEVASNDFSVVQRALERLTFSLRPNEEVQNDYELLGGRYCSIAGRLAAQLKLRHTDTDVVHTLYVTDLTEELTSIGNQTASESDTPIRLWIEGDRFFGLAGASAAGPSTRAP